jgi:molybdate transport system substrate-binding protein
MNRRTFLVGVASTFLLPRLAIAESKKRLMFYCGVTMTKAMTEMAEAFKKYHDVDIVIIRGGSADLYDNMIKSQMGDMYLPGEPSYILNKQSSGLFAQSVEIGHNKAVFMVRKGNPKQIKPDLTELLRKDVVTVLSSPEQGAIGVESKRILESQHIYDQAIAHTSSLAADSRAIVNAIKKDEADLALNWRSALHFAPNEVELIDLPEEVAPKTALFLTKLTMTKESALVDAFLGFAQSPEGIRIMQQHGF